MSTTAATSLTLSAEAAARVAALRLEPECEQMLEHTRRMPNA